MIDPRDRPESEEFDALSSVFREQLVACLEECAGGRSGLFSEAVGEEDGWPEAARLRELAVALQGLLSAHGERDALCDEFLDLCSMHGEFHPGEHRLARSFLERIEGGQVGTPTQNGKKPW
jgi:hypothetical protein